MLDKIKENYFKLEEKTSALFFNKKKPAQIFIGSMATVTILKIIGAGWFVDSLLLGFCIMSVILIGKLIRGFEDFEQAIMNKVKVKFIKNENDAEIFAYFVVGIELFILFFSLASEGFIASTISILVFGDLLSYLLRELNHSEYKEMATETTLKNNKTSTELKKTQKEKANEMEKENKVKTERTTRKESKKAVDKPDNETKASKTEIKEENPMADILDFEDEE